jgi:hypothetical protein
VSPVTPDAANGAVLLLYHRPPPRLIPDASTVMEHVSAFKRHSRFPVFELNTEYGFPPGLTGVRPGAVIMHYSLFGSGVYRLSPQFLDWLNGCGAYKICFFQDEFYYCGRRFKFLNDNRIDCVFTHVPTAYFDQVYGAYTSVPRLEYNVPGYVSEDLLAAAARHERPLSARPVDVGYRGRPLPVYMGRGSQEKAEIGPRFAELVASEGLALDIDISERGRLYGEAWYEFIASCRYILGVESGVSLFDLEDEVRHEYARLLAQGVNPTLEQLEHGALGRWDGKIPYRTVSPRHFEAAALSTCQVLFEGPYSGAMEPMVHYIPLRKDYSNIDEVLERMRDDDTRRELVANAKRDLIDSGEWSYARFLKQVDGVLDDAGLSPAPSPALAAAVARGARRREAITYMRWWLPIGLKPLMERIAPFTGWVREKIGRPRRAPHT